MYPTFRGRKIVCETRGDLQTVKRYLLRTLTQHQVEQMMVLNVMGTHIIQIDMHDHEVIGLSNIANYEVFEETPYDMLNRHSRLQVTPC